ncbi:hypothetical protein C8R45DRAFT_843646 [Mycena sanguinolenta]|nr:hypothetical protein C8R45DRAFT_843646 [Mycena sanguinolenta]
MAIEVPADAQPWLRDSVVDLTKVNLGCLFASGLASLVRLEIVAKYEAVGIKRLPGGKGRPDIIAEWIKGGRGTKMKKAVAVEDVLRFADEWDAWWAGLQPGWRVKDNSGKWHIEEAYEENREWGSLAATGVNGLVSAVAALYFWGVAVRMGTEDQKRRWEASVHDVAWVIEGVERSIA